MDAVIQTLQYWPLGTVITAGVVVVLAVILNDQNKKFPNHLSPVRAIPGLPVVGNLLQLKEKKPHKTFLNWVEKYGPIYSVKTGATTIVVLNSTDLAKEMAFGAGKRACAGALQASVISCVTIARLVQEFEWRLKDGEEENVATVSLYFLQTSSSASKHQAKKWSSFGTRT